VEEFPMTVTGKVRKFRMREMEKESASDGTSSSPQVRAG
jgi:hypothetical protein